MAMLPDDEETNVNIHGTRTKHKAWPKPIQMKWIIAGLVTVIIGAVTCIVIPCGNKEGIPSKDGSVVQSVESVVQITANDISFNMIKVEGGTFTMGATSEQKNFDSDEKPTHQVTLSSYYIGETEVTQALWQAVMGNTVHDQKDKRNNLYGEGDNYPMYYVSWDDIQDFICKLNEITKMNFRLPTEAEWEFAARGGNKSNHTMYCGSNELYKVSWYNLTSGRKVHPVKSKNANELGIYDMSGNVWEVCQDWYNNYNSDAQKNPSGPDSAVRRVWSNFHWFDIEDSRVRRGGGFYDIPEECRLSNRGYVTPEKRLCDLGFRLALSERH